MSAFQFYFLCVSFVSFLVLAVLAFFNRFHARLHLLYLVYMCVRFILIDFSRSFLLFSAGLLHIYVVCRDRASGCGSVTWFQALSS